MKKRLNLIISISAILMAAFACQSELNSPDDFRSGDLQLYKFETIESDLSLLKEGGMRVIEGDGVFSIGWNEIFRKFDDDSQLKGMAFAVAFGEENTASPHFPRYGLDMGMININYSGNQIDMHKMNHKRRGTAYSLFHRPFGGSENLLEYIPNTEYHFDVSGSEEFSPLTLSLTSPESLIDITSHSHGDIIDPNQDLLISWEGGNANGQVAVRVMAHRHPKGRFEGPKGRGGHKGHERHHPGPEHKNIFVEILETNPGQYTITAEILEDILGQSAAEKFVIGVSQFELGEFEHDEKVINTAERNGSSVMLEIE
jgi:hypothetical protein